MAKSLLSWRGAHFLKAVNPKPLPSQGGLLQSALDVSSKRCRAIGIASELLTERSHAGSIFFVEFLLSNFLFKNFAFSKLFSRKSEIPQPLVRD